MRRVYPALLAPTESGGFFIKVPDVSGCITTGKTIEEALSAGVSERNRYKSRSEERIHARLAVLYGRQAWRKLLPDSPRCAEKGIATCLIRPLIRQVSREALKRYFGDE